MRLATAHDAVLSSINIQREQLEKACVVSSLQEQVESLEAEKVELEKKHRYLPTAVLILKKNRKTTIQQEQYKNHVVCTQNNPVINLSSRCQNI